jgi:hypothetical protein
MCGTVTRCLDSTEWFEDAGFDDGATCGAVGEVEAHPTASPTVVSRPRPRCRCLTTV